MNYQGNSNIVQINTNSTYSNSQDHNDGDTEKSRTNLIVNYIPQNMTNDEFVDVFKQIGSLKSCKIIRDKTSGNSFGFGFAEYFDPTHATQAVNELNGMQIKDKQIKVAYAKALSQIKSGNLYVRFLPPEFSDKEIRNLFEPYGTISTCRILKNDQGMSRGVAFVLYDREESAKIAMENLDDTMLIAGSEQRISVKFADDAKQKHKFNSQKSSRQGSGMNGANGMPNQNNMAMQQQQIQLQNQMLMQQQALFQQLQQQLAAQMSGQQPQMQNQFSQGMSSTGPIRNSRNNNRYNPMGGDNGGLEAGDMQSTGQMGQQLETGNLGQLGCMPGAGGQMQNQLGQMNNMAQLISSLMGNNNQMAMNQQGGGMQGSGMQSNMHQNGDFSQFEHTAKNKDGYTLFVYNTGPECTEDQLRTLFSQYGILNKVALMKDEAGKSRGFAFVSMPSFDNACSAINGLNGYLLINGTYSNKLQVSFKVKK